MPGRRANLAAQIAETMWVLAGRNDIEFLSHYLPRAADFSDDGKTWRGGYGPRIRRWPGKPVGEDYLLDVDQWAYCIDLLDGDHTSRRAVINLWDPAIDTTPGKDLPCNDWLSFSSRLGSLDLHVAVRSNDVMWGWSGINHYEWASLLEITAGLLGVKPGALHFSITSLHLYEPHFKKANEIVNSLVVMPEPRPSPAFDPTEILGSRELEVEGPLARFDRLVARWFKLEQRIRLGYASHQYVEEFPEPMLRSWLRVIQWWWSGDMAYLAPLTGTSLYAGAEHSLQPVRQPLALPPHPAPETFSEYVIDLHNEKNAAYGDSWKRRGEMLGIMANIARKIDRLGKTGAGDTRTDTAVDLLVYLAKYHCWLLGLDTDTTMPTNLLIEKLGSGVLDNDPWLSGNTIDGVEEMLTRDFEHLEKMINDDQPPAHKAEFVMQMATAAYGLAYRLWTADQDDYRGADFD